MIEAVNGIWRLAIFLLEKKEAPDPTNRRRSSR